jgi:hypothetical protein
MAPFKRLDPGGLRNTRLVRSGGPSAFIHYRSQMDPPHQHSHVTGGKTTLGFLGYRELASGRLCKRQAEIAPTYPVRGFVVRAF